MAAPGPGEVDARVPVTLLTGFLGAGKTTLLNHLIAAPTAGRVVVIVNEAGDVALDGRLVVGTTMDLVELRDGCICCTIRGDLAIAVQRLLTRRAAWFRRLRFDRILVECSGLASPGPVVQTFLLQAELAAATRVDGVVAVASAMDLPRQLSEHAEPAEQLAYADHIVLNHIDRSGDIPAVVAAIRAINPGAPIDHAVRAVVPTSSLLDLGGHDPSRWGFTDPVAASPAEAHDERVIHVVLRASAPVDLGRLKLFLQYVAGRRTWTLMRLKGIFDCPGFGRAIVAHGVYQWLDLGPGAMAPPEQSILLLIGRGLDRAELERGWAVVMG